MELHLSLVSKVCTELETHVGCSNKTLAECIIELGRRSESVEKFGGKLKENGAEFPDDFVKRLLAIIHAIFPPVRKDKDRHRGREEDRDHKEKERDKEERDCERDRDGERHRDTDSSGRSSSSPERFEITQLAASGVVGMRNNPMHDDDGGCMLYDDEGEEEELEIELNEDEPAFLRGLG
ncbi:hypothetical protein SELMODRAFT_410444 [Selaginella moellendorffii]|uniref:Uncharacterized protein n=1 Tax=Selaginella moellendorffii TaxID=88036 RepID=D8RES4_SELML|nr:hypothetical protein SELMODRAFT_410444 [Selaginella moellendorffii]